MNNNIHNNILEKFGYPNTLIKEYDNWYWLIRPEQVTLGSSILITKHHYYNYSDLPNECFLEFEQIVKEVEKTLFRSFKYDKINYLMLMMNDPSVHYHVIPRFSKKKSFKNKTYKDAGYPTIPNLTIVNKNTENELIQIITYIKNNIK